MLSVATYLRHWQRNSKRWLTWVVTYVLPAPGEGVLDQSREDDRQEGTRPHTPAAIPDLQKTRPPVLDRGVEEARVRDGRDSPARLFTGLTTDAGGSLPQATPCQKDLMSDGSLDQEPRRRSGANTRAQTISAVSFFSAAAGPCWPLLASALMVAQF